MRVYYGRPAGKLSPIEGGPAKHVILGDWLEVEDDPASASHFVVGWRTLNRDGTSGVRQYRVPKADCREQALLEMIFLDVGQGDSCIVSVPDGNRQKILIVDAGASDNTHRFLNWRFRNVDRSMAFEAAVITHPDSDHYAGFQRIFDDQRVSFRAVYHNGLLDLGYNFGDDRLGRRDARMCLDVFADRNGLEDRLQRIDPNGQGSYPRLLRTAIADRGRFRDVAMASTLHGERHAGRTYLPGFAPRAGREATIEVVGPVPDELEGGEIALREFGDTPRSRAFNAGKTKNGHSVLLKLEYGGLRILFGGDLNRPAEDYLLRHYGEIGGGAPLEDAVEKAAERLSADILKCCHHGSADVTDEFLRAVKPFGVVVSSGDEESHVHPRPEVLGLLGKQSRGDRPILLCTEILRSTPESLRLSQDEARDHGALLDAFAAAARGEPKRRAKRAIEDFWKEKLRRLVTVYGAINVRTDGEKMIIAFRKEQGGSGSPWQLYEYDLVDGEWQGAERKRPRARRRDR